MTLALRILFLCFLISSSFNVSLIFFVAEGFGFSCLRPDDNVLLATKEFSLSLVDLNGSDLFKFFLRVTSLLSWLFSEVKLNPQPVQNFDPGGQVSLHFLQIKTRPEPH